MPKKDQIKLDAITPDLMAMVAAGRLEAAYELLERTLGRYDARGWGWPMDSAVDLMQRILVLCPGDDGVFVAVKALCGDPVYDERRKFWTRARYEQDLDDARRCGFVKGIQIIQGACSCDQAGRVCGSYLLTDAPAFPPAWCDSEVGCCCGWLNIFDDEEPPTPWRLI